MNATIVDLRYKMNEVLKALEKREKVNIFYHGKPKAVLIAVEDESSDNKKTVDHPFFGMYSSEEPVDKTMQRLRGPRTHDL